MRKLYTIQSSLIFWLFYKKKKIDYILCALLCLFDDNGFSIISFLHMWIENIVHCQYWYQIKNLKEIMSARNKFLLFLIFVRTLLVEYNN